MCAGWEAWAKHLADLCLDCCPKAELALAGPMVAGAEDPRRQGEADQAAVGEADLKEEAATQ